MPEISFMDVMIDKAMGLKRHENTIRLNNMRIGKAKSNWESNRI
jgi:hypothetical protein